jgi:hypothetical protein
MLGSSTVFSLVVAIFSAPFQFSTMIGACVSILFKILLSRFFPGASSVEL